MPNFRTQRIVGRAVKTMFALFVLAVNALIVWRVFISTVPPKTVKFLQPNTALCEAYEQYGDGLTARYQDQATITRAEDNYGYFSVTQCVFFPEVNQVQILVRYNNSTIRHLAEDYGLEELPPRQTQLFDVTLVKTTDLTPENREDNVKPETLASERIFASCEPIAANSSLYSYYRYTFDNVQVDDLTVAVFADIYYLADVDYDKEAYGTLCLYDDGTEWLDYKFSKGDRDALCSDAAN